MKMQQQSSKTIRKVRAATVGAPVGAGLSWALVILITWLASTFGVILPENVQMAIEVIIVFIGPAAGAWVAGYMTKPGEYDIPVKIE